MDKIIVYTNIISVLVTMIITVTIFRIKFSFNEKKYYRELIGNILKNYYGPLLFSFKMREKEQTLLSKKNIKMLSEKSYLLTPSIVEAISTLHNIEKNNVDGQGYDEEYWKLRDTIVSWFEYRQSELIKAYESGLETFIQRQCVKVTERFITLIKVISKNLFILLIISIWIFTMYLDMKNDVNNAFDNGLFGFLIIMGLFVFVILIVIGFLSFCSDLLYTINKGKGRFKPEEIVKDTGEYVCRVCGNVKKQYSNTLFTHCLHKQYKNKFKYFIEYIWEQNK